MARPRVFVTNDDGIDSLGLHVLARALTGVAEVTVVAPDQEYSGAGASIGALHEIRPEIHRCELDGVPESWSVTGPPGLCIMFVRLGAFGPPPDLVVSGINPGANVGRAVYHSGTVGAGLTARNGGIPSIAVSQSVSGLGVEGQGYHEMLAGQRWDSAATVAVEAARVLLASPPPDGGILNLNVPNLPLDQIKGWRWTSIGQSPPRSMSKAVLEPKAGHEGAYLVRFDWSTEDPQPPDTDTGAIQQDLVAASWLSRITALDWSTPEVDAALNALFPG
jgi:5'-nucleotidase